MRKNVGIIGLGIIGRRVVVTLRKKGFPVFVWNRTPRPVPNFVGSPAELAQTCDVIQIFVSDDDALLRIAQQIAPKLTSKHVVIAHSTVSPDSMRAVAEMVEKRRAHFVEAPFTGSKLAAEKGELIYYVGGDPAIIRTITPVLEASGKAIIEIGEIGDATVVKVATNMVTAACVQAAAEALALVEGSGVSLDKFLAAMRQNSSHSPTLELKVPRMISGDFEVHFSTKHMLKDMQIANRLARSGDLDLGVAAAARDNLLEQVRDGHGDDDYSSVVRKYFPEAGIGAARGQTLELFEIEKQQPASVEAAAETMSDRKHTPEESEPEKTPKPQELVDGKGREANPPSVETAKISTVAQASLKEEIKDSGEQKSDRKSDVEHSSVASTADDELVAPGARRNVLRRWLRRPPEE